jgi:23S rRNA (guanine2445-N2)-methyltransferase / 23S rRNA (guanine2069-N7)-methyltransferase
MADSFEIQAKTLFGLEGVLADELAALGVGEITLGNRIVSFRGDQRLLYRANLCCRTAIRFLKPIAKFSATNENELYEGVRRIDWREFLNADASLAIDPVVHSSFCTHSLYAAQLAKDAIVDQFRARCGVRPSVDLNDPDLRINLYMNRNAVTIHLDSSGDSLHKRGYRLEAGDAPINEVLAAGILLLTGWDRARPLVDPMCGSGTFVIEAARLARNIAPGILRRFAFERWKDYDRTLHAEVDKEARTSEQGGLLCAIVGADRDPHMTDAARQNIRNAGVEQDVRIETVEFSNIEPPPAPGIVVMNPPYDERLKVTAIARLYRQIGDTLKHRFGGYAAYVFTGNLDAAKSVGLRTSRRITLFNGPIECRLLRYEITSPRAAGPAAAQSSDDTGNARAEPLSNEYRVLSTEPPGGSPSASRATIPIERVTAIIERPTAIDSIPAGAAYPAKWRDQAEMFSNRLRRMSKHWKKWARRQGITCFRVYDRDIPVIPLAIDLYHERLHVAEFVRPHDRTEAEHDRWLRLMVETTRAILEIPAEHVYFKQRQRQRGRTQYSRQAETGECFEVAEGGHRFLVNLVDYVDTGLFLDHRITRSMVQNEAAGKRFLNLFGYTGSFSVYAAAGGAVSTTTVDLSDNYLDWARRNMQLNGFTGQRHEFICDDIFRFLEESQRRGQTQYDLAVVDPPTYSNSKKLQNDFDVQRDHVHLLKLVMARMSPGGKVYFSTNSRKFRFHPEELHGAAIREITGQTIPPDFRRKRPHKAWTLVKSDEGHGLTLRPMPN